MIRADIETSVGEDKVFVIDLDLGQVSATNDAEAICLELGADGKQIIYRDSTGRWDEMVHQAGIFQGFRPYNGPIPPLRFFSRHH